ncbi:gamma-glutamylcyclotransferase [Paracoccus alkanivorans]|uniref:glutathione-specific gamma-glutamylcyclotransferase n=1 Tax=Paracoccus alkanivorans TaxID=2116655 RepID=A0A3M0N0P0_9RHOB|nr:gamma-glutamylcyclotransferase [Paracoccus alkanivorans]RMC37247.1 gamma-glutamylcyclotransferase [Paracoccus alkanivorans]
METGTLWVFGYGSLIWAPGFRPSRQLPARLEGWQRRFCIQSQHYRGTIDQPGLVLALDEAPGQYCEGLALAVPAGQEEAALASLRARELARPAYREIRVTLSLRQGGQVDAVTYVVNGDHDSYCLMPVQEQARIIARATGEKGANCDYLWNTAERLRHLQISDPEIEHLSDEVRRLRGAA